MNITFVSFQTIHRNTPYGMVKIILPLLDEFFSEENITYFVSSSDYEGKHNIKEVSKLYKQLKRLIAIINRLPIIKKYFSGKVRLAQEILFDYFFSYKIKKPVVLVSSAYLLRSIEKNKKLGGVNIFIAGNPDDRDIYEVLKKEEKKYNLRIYDPYTCKRRVSYISNSLNCYDHIVTLTQAQYETYVKRINVDKLSSIESYIIPSASSFPNIDGVKYNVITFCYIAHTVWLKGLVYLLEAWEGVDNDNVRLIIGGTIAKEVEEYISCRFSNLGNAEFVGHVKDLNKYLRSSHVCVVPSLLDAGPATIAEAMYCGLPVIATEGCGASVLVDSGVTGYVVPSGKPAEIERKINWFIANPEKIKEMSSNATKKIRSLRGIDQYKIMSGHLKEIIENLVDKGNK